MRLKLILLLLCVPGLGLQGPAARADSHELEAVNVGYLPGWPTPSQFSQVKRTYDAALGVGVNWLPFDSGSDMTAALAAGELQIAFALGHVPFITGVTGGHDLTMVGIAVSFPDDDLCIVGNGHDITQASARRLEGQKVALVPGSVTHYRMLRMLEHLQVDPSRVEIAAAQTPSDAAAALRRGEVAMACAFGNALRAMADMGQPLMSGAELEAIGLRLFDVISVDTAFMHEHPEIVQAFMDVTEATNAQWKKNPAPMRRVIAGAAGMDPGSAAETLERFRFPSAREQKSALWLGALVPAYTRALAAFFVEQGRWREALDSYDRYITARFLR